MKLLNVDMDMACKIESEMSINGLDFSECSRRAFNSAAKSAYADILAGTSFIQFAAA
jgi:hypothetical protein